VTVTSESGAKRASEPKSSGERPNAPAICSTYPDSNMDQIEPIFARIVPSPVRVRILPRSEDARRRGFKFAFHDGCIVFCRTFTHDFSPEVGLSFLAEMFRQPIEAMLPVRSPLCDPILGSQQPGGLNAALRSRPFFSERTSPLVSRTSRCCTTAGSEIASGFASSVTDAGPRLSRSIIDLRTGTARAWKS
jgi:hypothetical protein